MGVLRAQSNKLHGSVVDVRHCNIRASPLNGREELDNGHFQTMIRGTEQQEGDNHAQTGSRPASSPG